MTLAERKSNT